MVAKAAKRIHKTGGGEWRGCVGSKLICHFGKGAEGESAANLWLLDSNLTYERVKVYRMTTTRNEKWVLAAIAFHDMTACNGARPDNAQQTLTYCWAEEFTSPHMNHKQVGGVLGSMVQKGLIVITEDPEDDNSVRHTDAGFAHFAEFCPVGSTWNDFTAYYMTIDFEHLK